MMMTVVERVLLLADLDVFTGVRTEDLAQVAASAREDEFVAGELIYEAGDRPDGLHVVVAGSVELVGGGRELLAEAGTAFGAWGLFDRQPRGLTARALSAVRLLSIEREAFLDVVADNGHLARDLLEALAVRVRLMSSRAGEAISEQDRIAIG